VRPGDFGSGQKGIVLVSVDNRGTGGRGEAFKGQVYRMKAFLKDGKDAEMVVYPAQDHGIYEDRYTTWHLSQRLAEFFERNL
jgi:hypothetical protein